MNIIEEIPSFLTSESSVILCTVISASGSTPAAALSKMLVTNNGDTWHGTVGGGCMEGDVLQKARELLETGRGEIMTFHLTEDDIPHGLICGGTLDVLIEPLSKNDRPVFETLAQRSAKGEDSILTTHLYQDGSVGSKVILTGPTFQQDALLSISGLDGMPPEELTGHIQKTHRRNQTVRIRLASGELILEPITGQPELIIFGGGHVSRFLSQTACIAGFRVTVVDDRREYANEKRFPEAARTIVAEYENALQDITIRPSNYVVIVTRGHRFDEEVLAQVIRTTTKYVGLIGSKRKVLAAFKSLFDNGVTREDLGRIRGPMGLEIGAVTAEEIAISVVSEMILVRRGKHDTAEPKSAVMKGLISQLGK
jgi:xanthine dehydrogenase accessory factor